MEINATQPNPINNPSSQQPNINNALDNKAEESIQSSDFTVTLSAETSKLPSQAEKKPTIQISSEEQAQQIVKDFQKTAANESNLALQSQSSSVTSEIVGRLIG